MKFFALFCILLILPSISIGQVSVTTSQILGTAKQQPRFQLQARKLNFLKNTNYQLPLINRWEFRTQTHDLDLTEQRFTFRVRPNSRKERTGHAQLHFSTIQYYQEENRTVLLTGLEKRYNSCLVLLFAKERKRIMNDLEAVYQQLAQNYEEIGDIEELLEAEENEQEISIALFDYQQEIEKAIRQTQYYLTNKEAFEIQSEDIISIEALKERMKSINPLEPIINPSLALLENEINLVEKELALEQAKRKKWFSFAQIRYGGADPLSPFRETVSMAVAFQLPVKGNSIIKTNKLELERITAENEWGKANYFIDKKRKNLLRDLFNWLEKYEQLSTNLAATQEKMTKNYSVKNTQDYEILSLKIRKHLLVKKLRLHRIEEKIFQAYIDWLAVSGKMIELPLVNYLTTDLQRF